MTKYKLIIAVLVLGFARLAYAADSWPSPCGKEDVQFKVKSGKKQPLPSANAGMAQIVFFESVEGEFYSQPIARFAVDGVWVGAAKGPSYVVLSVPVGIHHVCASRQSSMSEDQKYVGVADVTVDAGKTYYYDFKIIRTEVGSPTLIASGGVPGGVPTSRMKDQPTIDSVAFAPLSEDAAAMRLKIVPVSSSTPK